MGEIADEIIDGIINGRKTEPRRQHRTKMQRTQTMDDQDRQTLLWMRDYHEKIARENEAALKVLTHLGAKTRGAKLRKELDKHNKAASLCNVLLISKISVPPQDHRT